jgi:plastocyanin
MDFCAVRARIAPVVATLVALLVLASCGSDTKPLVVEDPTATAVDHDFTIPVGAGERFDRGDYFDILPASLEVTVGEVLRIVNEDDRDHLVGPFFVGAGETLTQRFSNPGEFQGLCTVHPSGQFTLVVGE